MKKKLIILTILTILLITVFIYLSFFVISKFTIKNAFITHIEAFSKMNDEQVFTIDEITLFSSANSENQTSSANHFTIQNLYQYTDIAFYITPLLETFSSKNTITSLSINNITIDQQPQNGASNIYFKSIDNFTIGEINEANLITESIEYVVCTDEQSDFSRPFIYNNLESPVTLSFITENIKTDYTITDTTTPITYDGSLLKKCNITISSLESVISFDVNITNALNEKFKSNISIAIPLESEENSIYNGFSQATISTNSTFLRYE